MAIIVLCVCVHESVCIFVRVCMGVHECARNKRSNNFHDHIRQCFKTEFHVKVMNMTNEMKETIKLECSSGMARIRGKRVPDHHTWHTHTYIHKRNSGGFSSIYIFVCLLVKWFVCAIIDYCSPIYVHINSSHLESMYTFGDCEFFSRFLLSLFLCTLFFRILQCVCDWISFMPCEYRVCECFWYRCLVSTIHTLTLFFFAPFINLLVMKIL